MKKRGLVFLFLFLVFSFSFISALDNSTEQTKIDKAYQCLTNKTSDKCSTLSTEEKIFSLLAVNECQSKLISASSNSQECWPSSSCSIKTTAQAILALNDKGAGTQKAQDWLNSKNTTPAQLVWYLEIEADNVSSCTIQYSGQSYTVNIDEDKKLSSGAGGCLILDEDKSNYLLKVSPSCYNKEFTISCNQDFLTTTLFQKSTSSTLYVSEETSSASASGATKEKIESYCFSKTNICDYEGTLWAAMVLNSLETDVSAYLPYLIVMADENEEFLPDAFLYELTAKTDYRISLLSKQKSNSWWLESGDKYYDTALALYPLQEEDLNEKENAKTWLLDSQDAKGCWEGNVRNTAFILASLWPEGFGGRGGGGGGVLDCEDAGYYCTSSAACTSAGGEILSEYDCVASLQKCCDTPIPIETCSDMGGIICSSNKICEGGDEVSASGLSNSQFCCFEGSCVTGTTPPGEVSECVSNNGICRAEGCDTGEEETIYLRDSYTESCCISSSTTGGPKSYWWVWVLLILIILVVIGIIFRNKLREFWFRISSGGKPKPGPSQQQRPFMPMPFQRPLMHRPPERRIMPPGSAPQRRMPSRSQSELDEVLRKLKEMGK